MEPYYLKRHGSFATPVCIPLNQDEVTVGRKETPELKNGPEVSRCHASFMRSCSGQWFVKDTRSTNGVFLNSVKIGSGLYTVNLGDIIGLGTTSGNSERDFVFMMCNSRTLSSNSSSAAGDVKPHCAESGHANNLSQNHLGVNIKKEVIEEELMKSNESESNTIKPVNHVFVKEEKPESSIDNLCNSDLSNTDRTVNNSAIHPLLVDSRNYESKNALAGTVKNMGDSLVKTPSDDIKNFDHKSDFKMANSSLKPSNSAVSVKAVTEKKTSFHSRSPQNGNCEVKVVLVKYDDVTIESYEIEKHNSDKESTPVMKKHNVENDAGSSCSDEIIPCKQRGRRLRINSSPSSDESKEAYVAHDKKPCVVSNVETRKGDSHSELLSSAIKSCALSTEEPSNQCYTQEDEIIIISSDDDDDYNCVKNPVPIKIKTEHVENDLSNSEWHYVSNSQGDHEIKNENPSDSETENVPCSDSVHTNSGLRTNLVTNHNEPVDDEKALEDLQWEHTADSDDSDNEELLDASENIENITKFLHTTGDNKSVPKKTVNGSKSGITASKSEMNHVYQSYADPISSDELERLDSSYYEHTELQNEKKCPKPICKKKLYAKVGTKSFCSSKNVESDISPHSKHLENRKQSSENFDRSSFPANHRSPYHEGKKGSYKKSTEAMINDFCQRQREKTLSKTVLTNAMPIPYRSRSKRGREEWFMDQYSDDKPTENKVVSKQEKIKINMENSSKNKADISAIEHKSSKSKTNDKTKRRKSKHNKNSSLRDQMQNRYLTIPFPSKSSSSVVTPSSHRQTYKSTTLEKNTSVPLKRKLPAVSDDTLSRSTKERRTVVKKKERFNSRMSFLIADTTADNTDLPNVASSRKKKGSLNLPEKSQRKLSSSSNVEISNRNETPVEQPSVSKTSQLPNSYNAQTLSSFNIHVDNSLVSNHSSTHAQIASRQHVPTRNSAVSQVPDLHHDKTVFEPGTSTVISADPHFQMISSSLTATTNSLVSGSSAVQTQTSWSRLPSDSANVSNYHTVDPRLQDKITAANSSASHNPDPTKQIPVSCSSTSQPADPRSQAKVPAASLPTTQISDPRLQAKTLNKVANTVRAPNGSMVVPHKILRPEPSTKLNVKLNSETFILNILDWMPAWLREQQSMSFPPPVVEWNKIQPLKLCYEHFDDYALSFYNLLLVEMWESLFQAWKEKTPNSDFSFVVTSHSENSDFLIFECESLLSERMSHYPVEGTLLIIDLRLAENKGLKLFGYTNHCKFQALSEIAKLHDELKKLPETKERNPQYCRFKFQTKKTQLSLCLNKRMKGCVLSYISVSQRIVSSLVSLQSSPLVKDVLYPQEKNCTISSTIHQCLPILTGYNKAQSSAIIAISDEMRKVYSVPRILLLQGPPGTGKTHVIIGIIENLICKSHEKIKILVTAPSNAAADEIGRRLIALRKSQNNAKIRTINFVRVGIPDQIHQEVNPFSLDSLVYATFKKTWNQQIERTKASLSKVMTKINDLKKYIKLQKSQNKPQQNIETLERELSMQERRSRVCVTDINILKNKTVKYSDPAVYQTKLKVLKNADVILSTLSSCRQSILEKSFGKRSDVHFTCCIIDEASQCTEPEALQPLAYGMCKLLLVGDHNQLPATVRSRAAVENHLERSLFERIHLHFNSLLGRSPVYMLTEQYRMHSEICHFPSAHFYSHCLKTAPEVNPKYQSFPIKPYFFLNVAYSKESNVKTSKTNVLEAEIIIDLCKALVNICPPDCSIGVITPYQGQKNIYETAFSRHTLCKTIEVNTVDSFQGREKDLVVISCVRAHSHDGSIGFLSSQKRLNVAITRAAKCLIICGHTVSLEDQPGWGALIRDAAFRKLLIPVTSVEDIPFVLKDIRKQMF